MRQTFNKQERLKSKKRIEQLFAEGRTLTAFPLKMVFLQLEHESPTLFQVGVSVSKRNFKSAVRRNRIKRLMREAYRKNKQIACESEHTKKHIIMFIYQGREEPNYLLVEERMKELLEKFLKNQKKIPG